jgi:hypothetical protein
LTSSLLLPVVAPLRAVNTSVVSSIGKSNAGIDPRPRQLHLLGVVIVEVCFQELYIEAQRV